MAGLRKLRESLAEKLPGDAAVKRLDDYLDGLRGRDSAPADDFSLASYGWRRCYKVGPYAPRGRRDRGGKMAGAGSGHTIRKRKFKARGGAELAFTELGFGAAPLGNLFRPMTEKDGARHPRHGLEPGLPLFRHRAALRPRPVGDAPQRFPARQAARLLSCCRPRSAVCCSTVPAGGEDAATPFSRRPRARVFDYSRDGVLRSLEFSLERLGVDHIDIVYAHDVDVFTHGSRRGGGPRIREFMSGGYRALLELREQGVIRRSAPASTNGRSPSGWRARAISTCSCSPAATRCWSRRR